MIQKLACFLIYLLVFKLEKYMDSEHMYMHMLGGHGQNCPFLLLD